MVSRWVHLSHVQSLHPLQANPPNIRNVSSIYSSACFVIGMGKSLAVSVQGYEQNDKDIRINISSAVKDSLTIPHLHGIQIDYFHLLDIFTMIFSLFVCTSNNHHLPLSSGCIGNQATWVPMATMGHARALGPLFGVQVKEIGVTVAGAVTTRL